MKHLFFQLLLVAYSYSFFLDGLFPNEFKVGDTVPIFASKVDSPRTHIPYQYYALNPCGPDRYFFKQNTFGDKLIGNILVNTPHHISLLQPISCSVLC